MFEMRVLRTESSYSKSSLFSNLKVAIVSHRHLKNSTEFEATTSAMPVQRQKQILKDSKGRDTLGDKSLRHVAGTSRRNNSPCLTRLIL